MSETGKTLPNSVAASAVDGEHLPRAMHHAPLGLLHYRPWTGAFRDPGWSVWPIARTALSMMVRRKLFWVLYGLSLLFFLMFFFGQYLVVIAESQAAGERVLVLGMRIKPEEVSRLLRGIFQIDGRPATYLNFFRLQGSMVVIVLALAGSLLVGNDFHHGSLTFYLAKPLGPWHYVLGKCLAVAVFVNLMTTLPALVLFAQFGAITEWDYYLERLDVLLGILGYGLVLTVFFSLLTVAVATWLRRTVPLIMGWTILFFFCRLLAGVLVNRNSGSLGLDTRWRLIDLWNDTCLVGNALLGITPRRSVWFPQPAAHEAALVLGAVCLLCLLYLHRRIRAVEIVK
jgi:ABC-type transport system involved in multi-copper enzyme maturation permease subunit